MTKIGRVGEGYRGSAEPTEYSHGKWASAALMVQLRAECHYEAGSTGLGADDKVINSVYHGGSHDVQ